MPPCRSLLLSHHLLSLFHILPLPFSSLDKLPAWICVTRLGVTSWPPPLWHFLV